jgi:hypothetical protein
MYKILTLPPHHPIAFTTLNPWTASEWKYKQDREGQPKKRWELDTISRIWEAYKKFLSPSRINNNPGILSWTVKATKKLTTLKYGNSYKDKRGTQQEKKRKPTSTHCLF